MSRSSSSSSSIRGVDLNSEESLPGMNRGGVHHHHHGRQQQQQKQHENSLVQQMMIGRSPNPSFWSMNELMMMMPPPSISSLSSSKEFPEFSKALSPKIPNCHDHRSQELPESWSHLLLENSVGEEGDCTYAPIFESSINVQSLVDKVLKEDITYRGKFEDHHREDEQGTSRSPRSCVTTSFSSNNNFFDFSNSSRKAAQRKQDHHLSPDQWNGNSTTSGPSLKKARVQASSVLSPLKVRKEKLGDRIAALHQLVSPFGKTDTASVLLEAIGYIRFLHGQIQALSSPYLGRASRDSTSSHGYHRVDDGDREGGEDYLRSRGLCLVPASFTLQVENDSAAVFWPPNNLEMGVYHEKLTY